MYDFCFLAIGDEIICGDIVNTNTYEFSKRLNKENYSIGQHISCADIEEEILNSLDFLAKFNRNIIVIGGLGPTEDDLTSRAISKFCNDEFIFNEKSWEKLQNKLSYKYKNVPNTNKNQCFFPKNSKIIANNNGTAEGFYMEFLKDRFIHVFPGPPRECIPMLEENILNIKKLIKFSNNKIKKSWNVYNIGESLLSQKIDENIKKYYKDINFSYRLNAKNNCIELKYFYEKNSKRDLEIINKVNILISEYL